LLVQHNLGTVGTVTPGTAITSDAASAAVKGAAAEVFSATDFDTYLVGVGLAGTQAAAVNSDAAMDLLVGAATEEVLIPDVLCGERFAFGGGGTGLGPIIVLPVYIPAGTRIAARYACARLSHTSRALVWLWGGDGVPPFRVGRKVTTYGITTLPDGTTVVPGASGAAGSHTQIVASTTERHFAFMPSFQINNDTNMVARAITIAMGIGAATEEELTQTWWMGTGTGEDISGMFPSFPAFADVPSGTRLTLRASNSGTNDAYSGVIHAVS
jgi:hypothetical protein